MGVEQSYLGAGLYTYADAARILNTCEQRIVSAQKLRRWAVGYWPMPGSRTEGRSVPVLPPRREFPELAAYGLITFVEMIEMHMVAHFRRYGVTLPTIRKAALRLSQQFQTLHPLALRTLHTDGRAIFAEMCDSDVRSGEREAGSFITQLPELQLALGDLVKDFFVANLEWEDTGVKLLRPLGRDGGVLIDPHRAYGRPICEQSGVPTRPLYLMYRGGETQEAIAQWYRIDEDEVRKAVVYEEAAA